MKRVLLAVTSLIVLSGCDLLSVSNYQSQKAEVEKYNEILTETLVNYGQTTIVKDSENENLLDYLTKDKPWSLIDHSQVEVKPLTEEEKNAFKGYGVIYDELFLAYGAEGIRQVVILAGQGYRMYVTIIWGKENVISVDRKVIKG